MSYPSIHRSCPVCASPKFEPYWRKGELRIARCVACGMVYVNPVPAGMASGDFYNTEGAEYYLSTAKLESDYASVRFERELRLFRKHCLRGVVLDVGCSSGAFLFQLKRRWPGDYEVLGTDVSGLPLDYAESRGLPVARGDFLSQGFGGRVFTAISFWATLEHLAEPKRFLEKAHAVLKPGGECFVLVPNFKSLAVRLLGAKYRYVYPQHLNYFTALTLTQLCASAGFGVIETRFTHFNPMVIWQDWRSSGREVSNEQRSELLKRTTAYKQKAWMKPAKWAYVLVEQLLAALCLADNLAVVLRRRP